MTCRDKVFLFGHARTLVSDEAQGRYWQWHTENLRLTFEEYVDARHAFITEDPDWQVAIMACKLGRGA